MALGDVIEVDERTLLVTGQELVVENGQPDVANSRFHLANRTLFLVDTGTTEAFRAALIGWTRPSASALPGSSEPTRGPERSCEPPGPQPGLRLLEHRRSSSPRRD
jgi:hypothetical protein